VSVFPAPPARLRRNHRFQVSPIHIRIRFTAVRMRYLYFPLKYHRFTVFPTLQPIPQFLLCAM